VSALRLEFFSGGLRLPELGLLLDPHEPCLGPERVFVSHAHSDHIAAHREVILSAPTSKLMQARLPGARIENVLPYGRAVPFDGPASRFEITLLPAGHIFGSSMVLIAASGATLLYTGDFKLRRGLSAEACEPRPADVLIMETTFGRPQYRFPASKDVMDGVIRFCREALDNDETPVLLGYSLGKSQEILCALGDAGFPLVLHGSVHRLTRLYEKFGQCFPKYERYQPHSAAGKVLLCPPNVVNSAMLGNLGKTRTAILTGWAVDPNCRYRYQCDAAFPLSDHADFPDLLALVEAVRPKQVYTLHGFAADFAQTLRERGYVAQALSQDEQFLLCLETPPCPTTETAALKAGSDIQNQPEQAGEGDPVKGIDHGEGTGRAGPASQTAGTSMASAEPLVDPFAAFARTCRQISADPRKLEKVRLLSEYLKTFSGEGVALAATWFSGRPFPSSHNKVLQLGWAVLRDALCAVAGVDDSVFHQVYLKHSDLGETAAELLQAQPGDASLTVETVGELFRQLQAARGPLAKTPRLVGILRQCDPHEAKYLVKIITGDLRIGLKEGLVEEAVALAFSQRADEVRKAALLLGDIGETARLAADNRLASASLVPFRPVKFMLASPEQTAANIWQRVQDWDAATAARQALPTPDYSSITPAPLVWIEDKYDGIRCQLHKVGQQVALYSRDLKDITGTFLELAGAARELDADVILDGEIIGMRGDQVLPFSELQKRLGRKQADLFLHTEVPIRYQAFDLLWRDGVDRMDLPLRDRRCLLESMELPVWFGLAHITRATSVQEIETAFAAARERGNEGLMIKDPLSVYSPGRRGLAWLKLKKAFATLDCVVVGAEYGHGKRSQVLSDYTFAVRDEQSGELKTIGKAYTGLTDAEIAQLTRHFQRAALRQYGRYFEVPPEIVLEVAFDRLQPSDRHSSGLAMRFPRIVRIRTDKSLRDIDTLESARALVAGNASRRATRARRH
jgi:DNA ligase 1